MNGGLQARDCVARKHGGRGLVSVEDCINQDKLSLERYVQSSEEERFKQLDKRIVAVSKQQPASKKEG